MKKCYSLASDRHCFFVMQIGKFIQDSVGSCDWSLRVHYDVNDGTIFVSSEANSRDGFLSSENPFLEEFKCDSVASARAKIASESISWKTVRNLDSDFSIARISSVAQRCDLGKTPRTDIFDVELRLAWDLNESSPPEDVALLKIFRSAARILEYTTAIESKYYVLNSAMAAYRNLDIGCLVFDASGSLLFINSIAQALTPIDAKNGKTLDLHSNQVRSEIRRAVAISKEYDGLAPCANIAMTLPSGTVRPTYFQVATPFDHGLETENRIISILVPTCECFPSAETLRAVFGLTRSEALVAAGISHGLSLREISDELSLSIETARTYSKRIYSKLGISRQSELVSQVLRVTLPEQSPRC